MSHFAPEGNAWSRLAECMRLADPRARHGRRSGGEEFVLMLPDTPLPNAMDVCERLRARVEAFPVDIGTGVALRVTISIGIATAPAYDLDALMRRAERPRPALFLCQQQLPRLLKPPLEAAGDEAQDTGQLNRHRHCRVEHVDDAGDGLTHPRDAEPQPVSVPSFAAGAAAAWQLTDDVRKAGFDATTRLGATELVWDADGDGCRHVPKGRAKRSAVQGACQRREWGRREDAAPARRHDGTDGRTATHPFTHTTCFSVCTTSTRSRCASITASMSL